MQFNNYITQEQISKLNHRSLANSEDSPTTLSLAGTSAAKLSISPSNKKEKRNATLFEFISTSFLNCQFEAPYCYERKK